MRSYSPHLGAISVEQETNRFGATLRIISFTRCSCSGYLNDQRKQTPIASTPASTRRSIAVAASDSFKGTTTSPKQSTRSETPSIRRLGTMGTGFWLEGKWRSEEHTSELQSRSDLVCRLLLEKKKKT